MKHRLQLIVIHVRGLPERLEKNGIQLVLLNDINVGRDRYFGAVFMVKHKGLVYFWKTTGAQSIKNLIVLIWY